jgi:hypothetical protein
MQSLEELWGTEEGRIEKFHVMMNQRHFTFLMLARYVLSLSVCQAKSHSSTHTQTQYILGQQDDSINLLIV